ncbi:hypothetical protein CcarbDRAFT_0775 [Clostridium carboxidivorans P7]|uniref:Uncharacterized protein n=1 Tax=Clostridium carboxidivorans P7 TaxID=536227 RepID=C6PPQ8_9CLOT|nr:hypothetical protein [Clostridium carboxidivorans]EET88788.1 hypothetical protein CcarbDRAFT_0775 [Clostridium carboxidivorans P7]
MAIAQDFYASIYLSNMVALAKQDANRVIGENLKGTSFLLGTIENLKERRNF